MPKHHYIPRFYLEGFTDPDTPINQEPYLWIHEPGVGWRKKSPQNTAAESGYYALPDGQGGQIEQVERLLAQVESIAASVLRSLLKEKLVSFQKKAEFAGFIALMMTRIPGQIDQVGETMAEIPRRIMAILQEVAAKDPKAYKAHMERMSRETGIPELADFPPDALDPDQYKISTNRIAALGMTMSAATPIGQHLVRMDWTFLVSRNAGFFIASDYPVSVVDPDRKKLEAGVGIKSVEVSFPLSKSMAVVMGWRRRPSMRWHEVSADVVAQINLRTALRARELMAPMTSFPGSDLILAARTKPLPPPVTATTTRVPGEIGYYLEFRWPPPVTNDTSWLKPVLPQSLEALDRH